MDFPCGTAALLVMVVAGVSGFPLEPISYGGEDEGFANDWIKHTPPPSLTESDIFVTGDIVKRGSFKRFMDVFLSLKSLNANFYEKEVSGQNYRQFGEVDEHVPPELRKRYSMEASKFRMMCLKGHQFSLWYMTLCNSLQES